MSVADSARLSTIEVISNCEKSRPAAAINALSCTNLALEARKAAGLTQNAVAERLRREDGRKVLPPYLNDLEHDRRYPPGDGVIEQLAKILKL